MRVIDLFAGCGGMSLGFENAGFDIIAAFDNWDAAIKIYESNFSHPIYKKDLSKDDIIQQLSDMRPDVIMGGPPCQDYSIAGKRELGNRANLTIRFGEIVIAVKPMWVVFENVYMKPLRAGHSTNDMLRNISNTSGLGYKHKAALSQYAKQAKSTE